MSIFEPEHKFFYMKHLLFTASFLLLFAAKGFAQFAILDPSFGSGGIDTFSSPSFGGYGNAIAFQPDGKILVTSGGDSLALGRLNYDGAPDLSFAGTGWAPIAGNFTMRDIALQPNGKILTIGIRTDITWGEAYVWRYNANGTPDNTFGAGGRIVDTAIGSGYNHIGRQSGGRIIFAGGNAMKRVDSTGAVDPAFGTGGYVLSTALPVFEAAMVIDAATGDIFIGGYTKTFQNIGLMRLTPNGAVDVTFGDNGIDSLSIPVTALSPFMVVKLSSAGKIILGSDYGDGLVNNLVCAQFNANGTLDSTFGNNGLAYPVMNSGRGNEYFGGIDLQGNNQIAIACTAYDSTVSVNSLDARLMRLNVNGSADSAFGILKVDVGIAGDGVNEIGVGPDGKIVLLGSVYPDLLLARVTTGTLSVDNISANALAAFVYPNPTLTDAKLLLTNCNSDRVDINVYDLQGRMVKQVIQGLEIHAGQNEQTISFKGFSAGTYVLSVTGTNTSAHILIQKI